MKPRNHKDSRFKKISLVTLVAVYLLILVGGIVRSTGSGMGCPDWPKCFGSWVPPTNVQALPDNYRDIYSNKRAKKNERFVKYLEFFGFSDLANEIRNDESILVEAEFNKYKTWTEYVNRLVGVVIGLLILLTVVASVPYLKEDKRVFYLSLLTFVLVVIEGWIGSIVVSTNLLSWMVTVHMLIALVIVALLIYLVHRVSDAGLSTDNELPIKKLNALLAIGLATTLIQIVLGTQVREAIDVIAVSFNNLMREEWIGALDSTFLVHRSYSLLILLLNAYIVYVLYKAKKESGIYKMTKILLVVIILEIASGAGMAYFAIPPLLQPIHLVLGSLAIGIQFLLILKVNEKSKKESIV
ncbi:COX15/CtaA family protein [Fulvivirgaceae bacterium BMA10]|uniref:COX15/CtaA family protein n=1 Tax=Splendidivirga corallicola TaxID=3051826 RepID=A0ABT8KQ17_9BACT|nr:COX15/CtaA family protein [Fulvivirgaceae bacterium BMA10]